MRLRTTPVWVSVLEAFSPRVTSVLIPLSVTATHTSAWASAGGSSVMTPVTCTSEPPGATAASMASRAFGALRASTTASRAVIGRLPMMAASPSTTIIGVYRESMPMLSAYSRCRSLKRRDENGSRQPSRFQ